MIQNVLRNLGGVSNYGVVSLCLFCIVFAGVLIWALTRTKPHLERMARLPLENESETENHQENPDESRP